MVSVGIRQLRQQASELIRMVREDGEEIQVTYHGKVVALIIPTPYTTQARTEGQAWSDIDRLAAEISARWPEGVTAVQATGEVRR